MVTTSVVVTNFNHERFLRDAIDSALAQQDGTEVIVVDDGSTDASAEVMRWYGGRITALFKANQGQASSINAGFAAASGQVICFLDADDLLSSGTMSHARQLFEAEPFAKLHWPLLEVDEAGRPLGGTNPPVPLPEGDLLDLVADRGPGAYPTPPSSGNAYSRAFLQEVMPVPEELRVCADGYLYDLAPLYGRVARLDRPGGSIRFHADSNFMAREYDHRLPHSVRAHELTIPVMANRCRALGRQPDEARWRARSWPLRSKQALADIAAAVPPSAPFLLIDGGRLGVEPTPGRPLVQLAEHATADAAIAELHKAGAAAEVLVVAWPSFSWLEAMPRFRAEIRSSYRPVLENDRVLVYVRLHSGTSGTSGTGGGQGPAWLRQGIRTSFPRTWPL